MIPGAKFNMMPERKGSGDPSMPNFRYVGDDRAKKVAELKAQGVPEDQIEKAIEMAESIITNKQAQAKFVE